jgi:GTPase SAR1 family protein
VAGDAAIGKTALLKLVTSGGSEYPRNYVMTSVPELSSRLFRVPPSDLPAGSPATQVDLILLDTPGSNTFNVREGAGSKHVSGPHGRAGRSSLEEPSRPSLSPSLSLSFQWESAGALMLCFDIGSRESFTSVSKWLRRVQEARASSSSSSAASPLVTCLVGLKADHREPGGADRAEVTAQEAKGVADAAKMPYFEVSAERGTDVERPFAWVAAQYAKRALEREEEEGEGR